MIAPRNLARSLVGRIALGSALTLALAGCGGKSPETSPEQSKAPSTPQSQVVMFGRASANEGERIYGQECAMCHVGRNTGTIMLGRRMDPAKAELHKRTDLDADYVKAVVRNGLVNMPPFSKVEISDQELDKVATWLAHKDAAK